MKSHFGILALGTLVLAASAGCAHRTTTVRHTSETVSTTGRQEVAPPVVVEDTTVIKRTETSTDDKPE